MYFRCNYTEGAAAWNSNLPNESRALYEGRNEGEKSGKNKRGLKLRHIDQS